MDKILIETRDLTKVYKLKGKNKEIRALNKVNLEVNKGEKFGLLGPNGAGKTTLIQILTTLRQPTSGSALIDGYDVVKKKKLAKANVGLMLESSMLYNRITAYDNLKFFSKIYKVPNYKERIYNIAEEFGLTTWLNQYVENFSSGMKMKLALCRTLLLDRKILFLDEPTLGLDVKSISFIVKKLKESDLTIFLTSHDMNVVEKLCDRVAFINNGNILKVGSQSALSKLTLDEIKIEISISKNKHKFKLEIEKEDYLTNITNTKSGFIISIKNRAFYKNLFTILSNFEISKIKEIELSLEDLFLKIN